MNIVIHQTRCDLAQWGATYAYYELRCGGMRRWAALSALFVAWRVHVNETRRMREAMETLEEEV